MEEEALVWSARRLSGEMSAAEQDRFSAWLRQHPDHAKIFADISDDVQLTDDAAFVLAEREFVRELSAHADAQDDSAHMDERWILHSGIDAGQAIIDAIRQAVSRPGLVAGAAVVSAFFMVVVLAMSGPFAPPADERIFATGVGEQQRVTLADGSALHLNTATRMGVVIDEDSRRVTLKNGEAAFDVASNPERPFVVETGLADIRVTGTAFAVRKNPTSISVFVTEGSVIVAPKAGENVVATRGEMVRVRESNAIRISSGPEFQNAMAWTEGVVSFDDAPLGDVIGELNRYYRTPLALSDKDLAGLRVTGAFNIHNQGETVGAITIAFGLEARRRHDRIILSGARPE